MRRLAIISILFMFSFSYSASAQTAQSEGGWQWPAFGTPCSSNCTSASVNFTLTPSTWRAGSGSYNALASWLGITSNLFAPSTNCPNGCLGQFGVIDQAQTDGTHSYEAFYELYCRGGAGNPPACGASVPITGFPVNPNDNFTFFMKCLTNCTPGDAAQTWNIKITNNTQLALGTPNSVWDNTVGNSGYGAVTLTWPLAQAAVQFGTEPQGGSAADISAAPYRFSGFSVGQAGANPTPVPLGLPSQIVYGAVGSGAYHGVVQPSLPFGANMNDGMICSVLQSSYSMACFQGAYTAPNNPGLGP